MAFDPIQEDCLRLVLAALRRQRIYPLEDDAFLERAAEQFQSDPAHLIETDADRSFHLTARAAELVDYRMPFLADEAELIRQEDLAASYLREAAELDEGNWDARRMLAELETESNDAFVAYLEERRADVERDTARIVAEARDPYAREFARDLAHRPYLRWLAALSSRALIAGRYRMALRVAEESLAYAPNDPAGVRHTAVLAMAKLEHTADELRRFRRRHGMAYRSDVRVDAGARRRQHAAERQPDPWTLLAQMSAAWHAFDYDGATRALRQLVRISSHAPQILYYQTELPEGLFSRVSALPGSEDELVLAVSEATPLLQEGLGAPEVAGFAAWIAENELVRGALSEQELNAAHSVGGADGFGGSVQGAGGGF